MRAHPRHITHTVYCCVCIIKKKEIVKVNSTKITFFYSTCSVLLRRVARQSVYTGSRYFVNTPRHIESTAGRMNFQWCTRRHQLPRNEFVIIYAKRGESHCECDGCFFRFFFSKEQYSQTLVRVLDVLFSEKFLATEKKFDFIF